MNIQEIKNSIEQNGIARTKIRNLLKEEFNKSKRTQQIIFEVIQTLKYEGLFILNESEFQTSPTIDQYLLISNRQLYIDKSTACLKESEIISTLQNQENNAWLVENLHLEGSGWSKVMLGNPDFWKGSRGRMDLHIQKTSTKITNKLEEFIIIEIKKDSSNGGMEQLNGYLQTIKNTSKFIEYKPKIRAILISGIEDIETHITFSIFKKIGIPMEWYIYQCVNSKNTNSRPFFLHKIETPKINYESIIDF